jgi:hypothetical protein
MKQIAGVPLLLALVAPAAVAIITITTVAASVPPFVVRIYSSLIAAGATIDPHILLLLELVVVVSPLHSRW